MFVTDADTIVSTAAAMTTFVRLHGNGQKSILQRGLAGVKDDEYNVVFHKSPATQPATEKTDKPATAPWRASDKAAMGNIDTLKPFASVTSEQLLAALKLAGPRGNDWLKRLQSVKNEHREGITFLLANMPHATSIRSIRSMYWRTSRWLTRLAGHAWSSTIPEEVFLDAVLPYANLNENRDHWRPDFVSIDLLRL